MIGKKDVLSRFQIKKSVRNCLESYGLIEVDVPALCPTVCPDFAVEPIPVTVNTKLYYLQPSPELSLKKFLSVNPVDCYSLSYAYRMDLSSPLHQPEFMMLEFYLIGENRYQEIQDVAMKVFHCFLGPDVSFRKRSYTDVWLDTFFEEYSGSQEQMIRLLERNHIDYQSSWSASEMEDLLFGSICQPLLGQQGFCDIIDGFPIQHAALAKINTQHGLASRFEMFWNGVELANGYDELIDPIENKKRFEKWITMREKDGKQLCTPIDLDFIASLTQLPPCSGVAIGYDRLMMFALRKNSLEDSRLFFWKD